MPLRQTQPTYRPDTKAVVHLVVEYSDMPTDTEISELLDSARNYGGIKSATLDVLTPIHRDLLTEGI